MPTWLNSVRILTIDILIPQLQKQLEGEASLQPPQ